MCHIHGMMIAIVLFLLAAQLALADDKEPPRPLLIPVIGHATTTQLGSGQMTRTRGGQSFTTTQLGSTKITRDSSGDTWRTSQLGNSYVTRRPGGQTLTTTKLGSNFVTGFLDRRGAQDISAWQFLSDPIEFRLHMVDKPPRRRLQDARDLGQERRQGYGDRHSQSKVARFPHPPQDLRARGV